MYFLLHILYFVVHNLKILLLTIHHYFIYTYSSGLVTFNMTNLEF